MAQETNGKTFFNPFFQWVTLLITIVGMNSAGLVYISSMRERIGIVEEKTVVLNRDFIRTVAQLDALQKLVTDGMTLRVLLQADAVNMKKQLDRIESLIYDHIQSHKTNNIKE